MQSASEAKQSKSYAISIRGEPRLSLVLTNIQGKPNQIKKIEKKIKKNKIKFKKIEKEENPKKKNRKKKKKKRVCFQ